MRIEVNGEAREVQAGTLADVLQELGWVDAMIATAVNGEFVAATTRAQCRLSAGDRLEVLAPTQGG